jgi:hypothetical protein
MDINLKLVLVKFFLMPMIFGALITNTLFMLLEILGFKYEKKVKLRCYLPIVSLVVFFVVLVGISLW